MAEVAAMMIMMMMIPHFLNCHHFSSFHRSTTVYLVIKIKTKGRIQDVFKRGALTYFSPFFLTNCIKMTHIPEKVMHPLQPLHHPVENWDFSIISFVMVVYQIFFPYCQNFLFNPRLKNIFKDIHYKNYLLTSHNFTRNFRQLSMKIKGTLGRLISGNKSSVKSGYALRRTTLNYFCYEQNPFKFACSLLVSELLHRLM